MEVFQIFEEVVMFRIIYLKKNGFHTKIEILNYKFWF